MPERPLKPRGRPRKTAFERRAASITVRLKLDESVLLERLAAEAGMTPSDFMRARAFGGSPTPAVAPELKHDVCRLLLDLRCGLFAGLAPAILATRMQAVFDRLQA